MLLVIFTRYLIRLVRTATTRPRLCDGDEEADTPRRHARAATSLGLYRAEWSLAQVVEEFDTTR